MTKNSLIKMLARKFVLNSRIQGAPKLSDFKLVEETLPELKDGEILAKAEWLSVDPVMRARAVEIMKIGDEFPGGQVARILKSRCPEYPEGTKVYGYFGWRDLTVFKPDSKALPGYTSLYKLPDLKGLPESYALGSLGMPGNTAFFGLTRVIQPKEGETLVVSAAAGAVGSLVGQIGKIKGCKVVGFAGDDKKLKWLKDELKFDQVFNYKKVDVHATLQKEVPQGVDCYFDNVGGDFAYHVMENMNQHGRIAQCGSISTYNHTFEENKLITEPFNYKGFRVKNLSLLGFNVSRWSNEWFEGISQIRDWILEGKIKVHETVTEGFENMPQAFIDLLDGKNTGKQIIKA